MRAESVNDCYVPLELNQRTWLIGYLLPGLSKVQTVTVARGSAEALPSALAKIETLTGVRSQVECAPGSMRVCFEAGYDGFWLARLLIGSRHSYYNPRPIQLSGFTTRPTCEDRPRR